MDSREDLRRSKLWRKAAPARVAEVCGRPAVGGFDPGRIATSRHAGDFPRRRWPFVPAHGRSNPGGPLRILHAQAGREAVRRGERNFGRGTAALTLIAAADKRTTFLRIFEAFFVVCLGALACASVCVAQAPQPGTVNQRTITRIEFPGARRISRDTLQARIFSKPGDAYDSAALDRDYHALWNTHFFEDLHIEVQDDPRTPNGVIVSFYVTERPVIRRIEYVGNKSITESDILDAYKEKKVGLSVDSQFDPTVVKRAQVILQALLAAHGHQFAIVKPTFERIPAANAVKLVFHIDEGPKVKVGVIDIVGNAAFSRRKLIRTMRNDRPYGIPLGIAFVPIGSKTFDEGKLEEDMEVGIRQFYQNHGYYRVVVDVKDAKTVDIDKGGLPGPWPFVGSKHGKATNITIEIQEGSQYRMGDLRFRSADPDVGLALRTDGLAKIFPLKKGDIFAADKLRKSLETYRDVYGDYGYIDFTATPIPEVDEAHKVINLTLEFDQQKPYYVRRIEFAGNTTTRDKVIRREIVLDEGQIYNKRLWDLSVLRLNQLGYFNTIKPDDAQLNKDVKNGSVDILLKLKEKAKQEISFSGGVSGISGSFIGFSYQTNNFLGLGETLSVAAQIGSIERNLSFGFTEPYLFDRPISAGFTVFAQKYDYNTARQYGLIYGQSVAVNPALQQNYNTNSKGFTIFASYPMRKLSFARFGLNYGWSTTDITTFSQSATLLFQLSKFTSLNGPSALKGIRSSKLTPTISYDTVNSQLNPTAGKSFSYQFGLEGGVLGGNVNSIENTFDMRYFRQTFHKRNVIAFHFQAADITGYG